ncbi:FKBP-type peptidyl-prolyl cis-trans isomerase [Porphyrobacter sp. ULC335]|uniref:FKBP-type peptidyl-prolyl cis-trans isomerase n=1 Tax=Porphyrobacter sp. ULC335 TaxID=2854260 RepID=UPI00221F2502|nr:FKBP-type peptidyl-prolyl cis-trans isomerase [Porphyrobacter sp. ULC335]UYV15577.1 FKBP-type peptidyl-prolyl cis-trans isomerase [Porphyrobacter sp. ULC335]
MTEITRVPIKPVAKGSLTKLWIGVILAVLVGAGLAWSAVPRGLSVDTEVAGTGPMPKIGEVVWVKYKGKLAADGTMFDESQDIPLPVQGLFPEGTPFPLEEGATVPGFFQGLQKMQKGGKYTLFIPADLAYGATPPPGSPIPPNADLEFEIQVIDIMSRATFDRNLQILQQNMAAQMGQQGGGAPEGAPQGAPQQAPVPQPGQ